MNEPVEVLGVKIVGGLKEVSTQGASASLLIELYLRAKVGDVTDKVLPPKETTKGLKRGQVK